MSTIPKLKETSCTCEECIGMCKKRPCWGTPEEIEKIMDAGYSHRLMYDYWVGNFTDREGDTPIIAPAIVNCESGYAPFWPTGRCTFLNNKDRCDIYNIRPIEARVAHHNQTKGIHREIAKAWDTPEGTQVIARWKREMNNFY